MLSFKGDIYGACYHVSADRISWHIVISPRKGEILFYEFDSPIIRASIEVVNHVEKTLLVNIFLSFSFMRF